MFSMALWMAAVGGAAPACRRRPARPQHARAPAGQDRRHGGRISKADGGVPLILFGMPDMAAATTRYAIAIPHLGSLILTHSWDGEVQGARGHGRAPTGPIVVILFFGFRIMVGLGFAMIGLGLWSLWHRWRGTLFAARWLQRAAVLMGPAGFVALLAGWFVTEAGRQPYTVYGLLRTADSVSPLARAGGRELGRGLRRRLLRGVRRRHLLPAAHDGQAAAVRESRSPKPAFRCAAPASRRRLRSRRSRPRRITWEVRRDHRSPLHLGRHHRLRGAGLCDRRWFRSRHRHPVSVPQDQARPRRCHELDRAGVGRQRDLAGARRRRALRGVSARLCGGAAGALCAADRDAARGWCFAASPSSSAGAPSAARFLWDMAFAGGSTLAALCQGIALGALRAGHQGVAGAPMRAAGSTG